MTDPIQTRANHGVSNRQYDHTSRQSISSALMKYGEVAIVLDVSLNHLRNMIDAGFLKPVRVGLRGKRIRRRDVDAIVRDGVALKRMPHYPRPRAARRLIVHSAARFARPTMWAMALHRNNGLARIHCARSNAPAVPHPRLSQACVFKPVPMRGHGDRPSTLVSAIASPFVYSQVWRNAPREES
jgi:excisionase family DNA binding protein